ncbi:putative membrane protein [Vibrio anguillarum]|nr:putative membrane protein [Vibrio anguillarum]
MRVNFLHLRSLLLVSIHTWATKIALALGIGLVFSPVF